MAYCPQCRAEFRDEISTCASCGVPLVAELPEQDPFASAQSMAEMLQGQTLRPAFVGGPTGLAELRDLLAERRIPSVIAPPQEGCSTTCKPRLMMLLRPGDVQAAHSAFEDGFDPDHRSELVQPIDSSEEPAEADEALDSCPACGAARPSPEAQECPECGLFLG